MSKKVFFLSLFMIVFICVYAQQSDEIAMRAVEANSINTTEIITVSKKNSLSPKYSLESLDLTSAKKNITFEEEHYLGDTITQKWNLFQQSYRRVFSQSVGLTNSSVEIVKPTVYNAVNKINNHFKKEYKKGIKSKVEISGDFNHILDCANLLFYEEDTKNIEADIKASKTTDELIKVFGSIRIVKN